MGKHPDGKILNPKVPEYMEKASLSFMKWALEYDMVQRPIQKVEIDESLLHSGDFIGVIRLDGLSPMIMYGTGAHLSHCTVLYRDPKNNELYVLESNDAWYWPGGRIQKTRFK